jgi:hypothetical protein
MITHPTRAAAEKTVEVKAASAETTARPMTGEQYTVSIGDGLEVYPYGEL